MLVVDCVYGWVIITLLFSLHLWILSRCFLKVENTYITIIHSANAGDLLGLGRWIRSPHSNPYPTLLLDKLDNVTDVIFVLSGILPYCGTCRPTQCDIYAKLTLWPMFALHLRRYFSFTILNKRASGHFCPLNF